MKLEWPRAWNEPPGNARIRCSPEDFVVREQLGFEPDGQGEHVFLHLQKRELNSAELVQRVSVLSGVPLRDIGISGLKDRNAVTRQWLSVGLAGRPEPDWQVLQDPGDVQLLAHARHQRKLRRGVHKANQFTLVLRDVQADRTALEQRLSRLREDGVPNYFGPQRFGRDGSNLVQARRWLSSGGRKLTRQKRSLYLSVLRAYVFNTLLAGRVEAGTWNKVLPGDVCVLHGSRSLFGCGEVDDDIEARVACGDIHPGLPLWGGGAWPSGAWRTPELELLVAQQHQVCDFLESAGLALAWRAARLRVDDFCWQFCDDGSLQLDFALGAGAYATALMAELVRYKEGFRSDNSSE